MPEAEVVHYDHSPPAAVRRGHDRHDRSGGRPARAAIGATTCRRSGSRVDTAPRQVGMRDTPGAALTGDDAAEW